MKYTKYVVKKTEGKPIPDGEPLFVLRGQDRFAAGVVRYYASLLAAAGNVNGARECMALADSMDAWPTKKYPD